VSYHPSGSDSCRPDCPSQLGHREKTTGASSGGEANHVHDPGSEREREREKREERRERERDAHLEEKNTMER